MNKLLQIYVDNSREVYAITERLINQITKRIAQGKEVEVNYLAKCTSMKQLISLAAKIQLDNEGFKPTTSERKEVALSHSQYIIECAKYNLTK